MYAFDKLKTIRKQNGLIILATQSPEDILSNPQGSNLHSELHYQDLSA